MYRGSSVTLLLPCLNEVKGLEQVLRRVPPLVDEVLVVDNGSTDGSREVARRAGARVIDEPRRGYGRAFLAGLPAASGDIVVACDSDGSYSPESIELLVDELLTRDLDFIAASRFPLQSPATMHWVSRAGNWLLTAAANLFFGCRLSDSQSGMWALRRSVLPRLHLTQAGHAFSEEMKLEALRHLGDRAQERRILSQPRIGESKLHPLRDGWDCLWFLIAKRVGWIRACPRMAWSELVAQAPFWAVVALALCLPVSLALAEAALIAGLAAWVVRAVTQRRWSIGAPQIGLLFAFFFGAAVLSMANSVNLSVSVRGLIKVFKAFGVFLLASDEIRTEVQLRRVVAALLIGAAVAAGDGLAQWVTGIDPIYHQPVGVALVGLRRVCGTYHHADDLGLFLSVILPVALAVGLGGISGRLRGLAWVVSMLSALALFLTFCRGGLLGFGVAAVGLMLVWRAWRWLAGLLLVGVVMIAALPAPIKAWIREQPSAWAILFESNEPGMSRPQIWRAAENMIRAHPWIGVGVNTFVKVYDRYRAPGDANTTAPYAHNQYLHMLAEIGTVGFAVFLLFLIAGVRRIVRMARRLPDPLRAILLGVAFGLLSYLLNGVVESALYYPRQAPLFWLGFGIVFSRLFAETCDSQRLCSGTGRFRASGVNQPSALPVSQ